MGAFAGTIGFADGYMQAMADMEAWQTAYAYGYHGKADVGPSLLQNGS